MAYVTRNPKRPFDVAIQLLKDLDPYITKIELSVERKDGSQRTEVHFPWEEPE